MAPAHQHTGYAPSLDSFLHTKLHLEATIETAVTLLKRRQIHGPEHCALATAHVLSQVVAKSKWTEVSQLLDRVCQVGRKLVDAQPQELVIGNIIRRVLGLIRDEAEEDRSEAQNDMEDSIPDLRAAAAPTPPTKITTAASSTPASPSMSHSPFSAVPRPLRQSSFAPSAGPYQSMFNLLSAADLLLPGLGDMSSMGSGASTPVGHGVAHGAGAGAAGRLSALRDEIIDGIEEIKDEIGQADDQIAGFAEGQIRPGDYIMVYEPSRTVEKFLIKAAARRRYTLLLVTSGGDTAQRYASLLKRLSASKTAVIRVAGSAVASYMARTTRVVLDARAIAANGGVLVKGGGGRIARAAHTQGRAVIIVGGVYKVSPEPWTDPEALVEWGDPGRLGHYADGAMLDGVDVASAVTEYVSPDLVDIYVTNLGPHSKHYLESVIADHYKHEDLELYGQ